MELRTRILPKMLNSEVEAYLERNDIIIVPVRIKPIIRFTIIFPPICFMT